MHARFVTSVVSGLAGGFVVVASQAFVSGTTAWLTFAFGVGLLLSAVLPTLFGDRGLVGLAIDGIGGVLAVWTIVASLVFSGDVVRWLSFAEGAGFVILAVGGLILNQVRLTRRARLGAATPLSTPAPATVETSRPAAVAA